MFAFINEYIEAAIAAVLGLLAGFTGAAKLFFGLRSDVAQIKSDVADLNTVNQSQQEEINEMKQEAAAAKSQRDHIVRNTDMILKKMMDKT